MNRTELVVRLKYEHTDDIGADEVADRGAWASCVWSSCGFRHGPCVGQCKEGCGCRHQHCVLLMTAEENRLTVRMGHTAPLCIGLHTYANSPLV